MSGYMCVDDLLAKINSLPANQIIRSSHNGKRYVNISLYANRKIKDVFGNLFSHTLFVGKRGVKTLIADLAEFKKDENPPVTGLYYRMPEKNKRRKPSQYEQKEKKAKKKKNDDDITIDDLPF